MHAMHADRDMTSVAPHRSRGRLVLTMALGPGICAAACTGELVQGPSGDHVATDDDAGTGPFAGGDGVSKFGF
jgi:hypothetical protein